MVQLARLKLIRERKALTQQQLAERARLNRATIMRLEHGNDHPFPTTVSKLADALGVEPEDLAVPLTKVGVQRQLGVEVGDLLRTDRLAIVDRDAVSRFLREEPDLATLVTEAADQLVRFIPDARLTLDLLSDPDDDTGEQLFLGISTCLEEDDALAALRRFDQAWWVQYVRRARGLLCIDLSDE